MKYYARFLTRNAKRELVPALGSDGTLILDGRHSADNQNNSACLHAYRLRHIHKYAGFHIHKGERFDDKNPIVDTTYFDHLECN